MLIDEPAHEPAGEPAGGPNVEPNAESTPVTFAIVGRGWRAAFFLRLAAALPDRFAVSGVLTRDAARGREIEQTWGVPTVTDLTALLSARPEFVITSVPRAVNPALVVDLVSAGVPVLSETPPASDLRALRQLWEQVGRADRVQVAEQYPFQPLHAARILLVREGLLGTATQVQVCSTHGYHAVALIRALLDVGFAGAEVSARTLHGPLIRGPGPAGWPADSDLADTIDAVQTIATLDFGDGRSALYDFTDNQWWHPLRAHRHVVRGSHGEIVDASVTTLADHGTDGPPTPLEAPTPVTRPIMRRQSGVDGNLEGSHLQTLSLDGRVLWRNRFAPARLADEELAIADVLARMGAWVRGVGPAPYPLAQACQDHLLALAIEESAANGRVVRTTTGPWVG